MVQVTKVKGGMKMDEEQNVQPEQTPNPAPNPAPVEKKGFNITSMILGIIAIVCFCWWYISLPCAIIAIIFSIAGKKEAGRGMGVAGLVLGIISLVLDFLVIAGVASILGLASMY